MGSYNRNTCSNCGTFIYDGDTYCDECIDQGFSEADTTDQLRIAVGNMPVREFLQLPESLRYALEQFMRYVRSVP